MQAVDVYRKTVNQYTSSEILAWVAHTCSCDGTRDAEQLSKIALTASVSYYSSVRSASLRFSQLETFKHV